MEGKIHESIRRLKPFLPFEEHLYPLSLSKQNGGGGGADVAAAFGTGDEVPVLLLESEEYIFFQKKPKIFT